MEKYTQKQLKELVKNGIAKDITGADSIDYEKIRDIEGSLITIGYSHGTYVLNGLLIKGYKTKQLYAITARSTALFIFG